MMTLLFVTVQQAVVWLPMLIAGFCLFKMKSSWRWAIVIPIVLYIILAILGGFAPGGNRSFTLFVVLYSLIGFLAGSFIALLLRKPRTP